MKLIRKLSVLLCYTKALPLCSGGVLLAESQTLFLGSTPKNVLYSGASEISCPVSEPQGTDVYNLVNYSNNASIFQLFEFIYYLTIEFLLSFLCEIISYMFLYLWKNTSQNQ